MVAFSCFRSTIVFVFLSENLIHEDGLLRFWDKLSLVSKKLFKSIWGENRKREQRYLLLIK